MTSTIERAILAGVARADIIAASPEARFAVAVTLGLLLGLMIIIAASR